MAPTTTEDTPPHDGARAGGEGGIGGGGDDDRTTPSPQLPIGVREEAEEEEDEIITDDRSLGKTDEQKDESSDNVAPRQQPTRPSPVVEEAADVLAVVEDEGSARDHASSQYQSCTSTCMVVQTPVITKVPVLNDTFSTSASEDEENPAVAIVQPSSPTRTRKSAAAGSCVTTNHHRNVIAAGVVTVALVGLGLGFPGGGDRVDNSEVAVAANPAAMFLTDRPSHSPSNVRSVAPSNAISDAPSNAPSVVASSRPSGAPSTIPSLAPSVVASETPSSFPSGIPTPFPTLTPTASPSESSFPTLTPSGSPSTSPSDPPTPFPSSSPTVEFVVGDLAITNKELGIRMSSGLSARVVAETGRRTKYADGTESVEVFHEQMDGAGIVPLSDGRGYVYVSNSEIFHGGGVYGLYFNEDGEVTDYKTLLGGTNWNCGGGLSPWNTWISCEESSGGQCWQVDPDPWSINHETPMETLLGGDGGRFETVAVDNRNPNRPVFFTTEDYEEGALRRFEADHGNGWDALHEGGTATFLRILDESNFQWTTNEWAARNSAATFYRNSEGVAYHDGFLYFVAKTTRTLFILNLDDMTYKSERTGGSFSGKGNFNAQPDQVVLGNYKRWIYFTEDGGDTPGVYVRDVEGVYHTVFEAIDGTRYSSDETVGIALSPDRRKLYAGFQVEGLLMEFTRDDGFPFE